MSDTQVGDNPLIINVPMALSAQTVNTNIPDLNGQNLKLDGPTLAGIYSGKIQSWDDPAIAAINTGVKLPTTRSFRSIEATPRATRSFSPST
jgi:phosphate transport system substrate-binding protein